MSKATIIAITGKSGAGKTYASLYLKQRYGFHVPVSYTTRPQRQGERDGREHFFVTEDRMPEKEKMMAYTQYGGYHYWTWQAQFIMPIKKGWTIAYVVDEEGLRSLKRVLAKRWRYNADVISVRIKRTDDADIDDARKARDEGRFTMPDESFDYIINNSGKEAEFQAELDSLAEAVKGEGGVENDA